jgi:hypothetical protein
VIDLSALLGRYTDLEPDPTAAPGGPAYRAVDAYLGRRVVIRALPRLSEAGTGDYQALFRRGARAVARLHHPNIIQVHDHATTPTANLLVMEYAEGEALDALLRREGALPPERAFPIARQLAEVLDFAHQAKHIHRNLKPTEVLLTPTGQVKLGGFEAAVMPADADDEWQADPLLGNALYMAPEQVQGQPLTTLSDQYALGVLLYQMLTGQPPFTGARPWAVLYKKTTADPRPPSALRPALPAEVDALVLKLLRRSPDERFAGLADFRRALAAFLEPAPAAGQDPDAVARRYPAPIAIASLLVWQEVDWQTRLQRLLYLFEATLKYCSVAALLGALQEGAGGLPPADRDTLRRPSLGHWAGYLRGTLAGASGSASRFRGALTRFYHEGTPARRRGADLIDYGVQVRNKFGHGVALLESAYRQAFEDLWPHVQALLAGLEFLAHFPLGKVVRLRFADKRFVVVYRSFMGALPVFPTAEAVLRQPVEEGRLGVLDPEHGTFVDLGPLLLAQECQVCGDEEIFYYNGMKGKQRAAFLSYQKGHSFDGEFPDEPFGAHP